MSDTTRVDAGALRATTAAIFAGLGLSSEDADVVADALIEADLLGVSSHGVSNYPGIKEARAREDRLAHGVPLHPTVLEALRRLCGELGLEPGI